MDNIKWLIHTKLPHTNNIPLLIIRNNSMQIKLLQRLRIPKEAFIPSDCIICCKIALFSNLSSSIFNFSRAHLLLTKTNQKHCFLLAKRYIFDVCELEGVA